MRKCSERKNVLWCRPWHITETVPMQAPILKLSTYGDEENCSEWKKIFLTCPQRCSSTAGHTICLFVNVISPPPKVYAGIGYCISSMLVLIIISRKLRSTLLPSVALQLRGNSAKHWCSVWCCSSKEILQLTVAVWCAVVLRNSAAHYCSVLHSVAL